MSVYAGIDVHRKRSRMARSLGTVTTGRSGQAAAPVMVQTMFGGAGRRAACPQQMTWVLIHPVGWTADAVAQGLR